MNQTPLDEFAAEAARLCALGSLPTAAATVSATHYPATPSVAAFTCYRATVSDTAFAHSGRPNGVPLFSTASTCRTISEALADLAKQLGVPYACGPVEWATSDQREVLRGMAQSAFLTRPERIRILLNLGRLTKGAATTLIKDSGALIRSRDQPLPEYKVLGEAYWVRWRAPAAA
jgi:hypothetical protein